jgi:hypothetical protein
MKKFLAALGIILLPGVAFAGTTGIEDATDGFVDIVENLTAAADALIPFFLAIAVVVFIYGVIKYILATGADDKSAARGYIIYGIIGIAVIVSLFGIIRLLQNTFGISSNDTAGIDIPQFGEER